MNHPTKLIAVNNGDFDAVVLGSQLPVVVDFWAPWCGPCRLLGPVLAKFAVDYAGKLVIAKLNTDENKRDENYVGKRYGVSGIPHVAFFANGQHVSDCIGFDPYDGYKPLFEAELAKLGIEPAVVDADKEAAFAAAVNAALERYESTYAPIQERVEAALAPVNDGIGARVAEARAKLERGEMTAEEFEPLNAEYREAYMAAFEPLRAEYKAVGDAANEQYEQDLSAALAAYQSDAATATAATTAPDGVVCEDGVCRIVQ